MNLAEMPPAPGTLRQILVVALAVTMGAGCAPSTYDFPNTLGVMPQSPPRPIWLGTVRGSGNTPVSGAAAVTPSQIPGWAHVMLSVDNTAAGQLYSWSLRSGSCGSDGGVVGPADRYPAFAIHADGTGAAETLIPTTLSQSESYAVIATPVSPGAASSACANLTRTAM